MSEDEIKAVVQAYLEGAGYAYSDKLRQAFHENFRTAGFFESKEIWSDRDAAIKACEAGGIPSAESLPPWQITKIIVNGDTSLVVVESEWSGKVFLESLTLLRTNGRWQIVFKAFHIKE